MEFRDPTNQHRPHPLHQSTPPAPPPHHHQNYQPPPLLSHPSSSFSFLPNPNPNSIHAFETPLPHPSSSDANALRPPGVEPYTNPYASHLPFGGHNLTTAQSYQQEALDYYYQLHQQQYAVKSFTAKVGSGNTIADLEIKKLRVLQCGAPADSVKICSICNVVCNSDKVFASHIAGEKHKLKAQGLPFNGWKPKVPAHTEALHVPKKSRHPGLGTAARKALMSYGGSSVCDVCKIDCNSQEVLSNHMLGRKHRRKLQDLQESIKPKPNPVNDLTRNPNPSSTTSGSIPAKDDLETKKQKVLNGGAAAGAVRVCMECNVVCNSQEVYNSHIVGKKHISMVSNKQQQATTSPVS